MKLRDLFIQPLPKAPPAPAPKALRQDGWINPYVGFGTSRDKLFHGCYVRDFRLPYEELSALYYGDDLAAKIVDFVPREAMRRGYEVLADDNDAAEQLEEYAEALDLDCKFVEAWTWGRLYGGCLLIIGADDGQDPMLPLAIDRIQSVRFLNVVDCRSIQVFQYYQDPLGPNYGRPEIYQITSTVTMGQISYVHESRCMRFEGVEVDPRKRAELAGWSFSVLQRCYETLRAFATAFQASGILLTDSSQGVFKLQGLIDMITSGGVNDLQTRMQLVDMTRSASRSILLDAESESFEKIPTSFAGLPEMLDRFMQRLASASGIPVSILMGRSAAGMNATGDLDVRMFYDMVASEQEKNAKPRLEYLYDLLALSKKGPTNGKIPEGLEICFPPLWQPTDQEAATLYSTMATADNIYVTMGALKPEEVAIARFGKGEFSTQVPTVDVNALEAEMKDPELTLPSLTQEDINAATNRPQAEVMGQAATNASQDPRE